MFETLSLFHKWCNFLLERLVWLQLLLANMRSVMIHRENWIARLCINSTKILVLR